EFFEGEAAIPAGAGLVEHARGEDVRLRQAYVLVVPVAPVTAIAAAGTEERKQVAHEIVVEVVDVAAVEGVLRRNVVIDSGGDFVRNIASRADRSLKVVYQGVVRRNRHEVQGL